MYEIIKGRFWYTVAPRNSGSLTYVVEWWMYMYVWVSRYGGRAKRDDEVTVRAACYLCWDALLLEYVGTGVLGGGHHSFEQMRLRTHCPPIQSVYTVYTVCREVGSLIGWVISMSACWPFWCSSYQSSIAPLLFTHAPRFLPMPKYHGWWAGGQNRECHVIFRASSVFLIVWECSVQSPISSSKVLIPPTLPPPF